MLKNNYNNKNLKNAIYLDDFNESLLINENDLRKTSLNAKLGINIISPLTEDASIKTKKEDKENLDNLNLSRYYMTISNFFACLSAISVKLMEQTLPGFNIFLMVSFRFAFFALSSYFFIYKNSIEISGILELKDKKWFYIRIISNFVALLTFKYSFDYIRLGLSISLAMFAPIWGNLFSIYFFKEKFDIKYIIGCSACLLGTYLIGIGEDKGENNEFTVGTLIGIIFGFSNSILTAVMFMTTKFLLNTYNTYELNYTLGVYIAFYTFFLSFLQFDKMIYTIDLGFFLLSAISGIVTFFSFHFSNLSMKLAPYNKISYITYTQIVFSLIAGMLLFGESLNILDFLGSFIIIGYNAFSSKYFS